MITDKLKAYKRAWYLANRERLAPRHIINQRKRRALLPKYIPRGKDPLKRKEACARYYQRHKDAVKARNLAWRLKNPDASMAVLAKRRAAQKKATPAWANNFFIQEAYRLAVLRTKMFGFKWDVDHIVPLQSKLVCGLHTHTNLQVIPRVDNVRKSNRHWPDMP